MSPQIVPLTSAHLPEAACLAAQGYRRERARIPLLPSRQEDPGSLLRLLEDLCRRVPGVAALEGGELVGFMAGMPVPQFKGRHRGVYCPEWAHAVSGDGRRLYQSLYQGIAPAWLENGCFTHVITLLAQDREALDACFWIGFGLLVVDALRGLDAPDAPVPASVRIRRGSLSDLQGVLVLGEAHERYMAAAPTFMPLLKLSGRDHWERWLAGESHQLFLAEGREGLIAYMRMEPAGDEKAHAVSGPGTASITGAFTLAEHRGSGVAAALLGSVVQAAGASGYERLAVDFESANSLGSRFWLRHFTPVAYSLIRHVDDRLAWAHEHRSEKSFW